jgi:hypothetical protein
MYSLDVLGYYLSHFDVVNTSVIAAILDVDAKTEGMRWNIENKEGKESTKNFFTELKLFNDIELNTIFDIIDKK